MTYEIDGGSGARFLRRLEIHQSRLRLPGLRLQALRNLEMVRLDIMINGERVDTPCHHHHKENAQYRGRQVVRIRCVG